MDWKDKKQVREYHRNWRRKNWEKVCESNRRWKINNPERCLEFDRVYKEKNKEKIREYARERRKKYGAVVKQACDKYRKEKPWMVSLFCARRRCEDFRYPAYKYYGGRGIWFKLTKEEVKLIWFRDKAYRMKDPTLDRKNNDGHYELNNCQFLERVDNAKKQKQRRNDAGRFY